MLIILITILVYTTQLKVTIVSYWHWGRTTAPALIFISLVCTKILNKLLWTAEKTEHGLTPPVTCEKARWLRTGGGWDTCYEELILLPRKWYDDIFINIIQRHGFWCESDTDTVF